MSVLKIGNLSRIFRQLPRKDLACVDIDLYAEVESAVYSFISGLRINMGAIFSWPPDPSS